MATTGARQRSAIGTTIPARYEGFCKACGQTYPPGELITKVAHKTWVHQGCVARWHQLASAAAAPGAEASPPAATEPVAPPGIPADLRAIVRKELEGAELSVDEQEVRLVVRDEMVKAGTLKVELEVKLPSGQVNTIQGKAHAKFEPPCGWPPAARTSS